ncbi:hypothetical protein Tco_0617178 [Tanacetum coccineum]
MSNTINNMKTQTSSALHNIIMEVGGKDHPPITIPVAEGSSETTIKGYMENYKNVSEDIRNLLNAKAKGVHIILTGIDNDIYSTFDACPNAMEMWKAMERSQQAATRNRGKAIVNSPPPIYDQEPDMVTEDDALPKEKEIDKLMALISPSLKKIYKPTNNNIRTSSNTSRANQDNTLRINRRTGYDNHMAVNVAEARETIGNVRHQNGQRMQLITRRRCFYELEAHYMYMAQIQEVILDDADNSGPVFDIEPLQKVQNKDDNYNVFAIDRQHPEQPEFVNDTYLNEQGGTNITTDLVDMSTNGEEAEQDDDDLARECDLLASLIEKLKCEINDIKNHNKLLESSNKTLADKLKSEIKDFKNKNKCLESSSIYFKVNPELVKNNQLMFKDLKKFQAELDREYYYADHMNAILGVYTNLDEVTNLQCDYLEALEKCQNLENKLSKRNTASTSFEALQQHAINLELAL